MFTKCCTLPDTLFFMWCANVLYCDEVIKYVVQINLIYVITCALIMLCALPYMFFCINIHKHIFIPF